MSGRTARAALLVLCVVAALAFWPAGSIARADNAISVSTPSQAQGKFPDEIDFSIGLTSSAGAITDVELHYALQPNGVQSSTNAVFSSGTTVQATYVLRTGGNPLYVPPSKVISYYWTAQDAAGNTLQTDATQFQYNDTRFKFKTLVSGNLTLYYYTGSDSAAQNILDIGRKALDRAGQIDGAPLDFDAHLVVYGSQSDIAAALSHELQGGDPNVLGQADPPNIVVLDAGNLSGQQNEDTVRHELTHLVNARAVEGAYKNGLPLWLDEGLAVYSQNSPGGFDTAVNDAIRANRVVSIKSLSPGYRGTDPDLFYGEAWSIAKFLDTNFGPGKIAALLAQFKSGKSEDAAFQAVYNLDRDGIYNAWRKSVGLAAVVAAPTSKPAAAPQQQQPAPTQIAAAGSSDSSQGSTNNATTNNTALPTGAKPASSDNNTLVIVIGVVAGAAALLALAGIAVIGGLALSRRGKA
jgi:hypothetical protein